MFFYKSVAVITNVVKLSVLLPVNVSCFFQTAKSQLRVRIQSKVQGFNIINIYFSHFWDLAGKFKKTFVWPHFVLLTNEVMICSGTLTLG